MRPYKLILFLFLLSIISCGKEETIDIEPATEKKYTIALDIRSLFGDEVFAVVTNQDHEELYRFEGIELIDTLEFITSPTDKLDLTYGYSDMETKFDAITLRDINTIFDLCGPYFCPTTAICYQQKTDQRPTRSIEVHIPKTEFSSKFYNPLWNSDSHPDTNPENNNWIFSGLTNAENFVITVRGNDEYFSVLVTPEDFIDSEDYDFKVIKQASDWIKIDPVSISLNHDQKWRLNCKYKKGDEFTQIHSWGGSYSDFRGNEVLLFLLDKDFDALIIDIQSQPFQDTTYSYFNELSIIPESIDFKTNNLEFLDVDSYNFHLANYKDYDLSEVKYTYFIDNVSRSHWKIYNKNSNILSYELPSLPTTWDSLFRNETIISENRQIIEAKFFDLEDGEVQELYDNNEFIRYLDCLNSINQSYLIEY